MRKISGIHKKLIDCFKSAESYWSNKGYNVKYDAALKTKSPKDMSKFISEWCRSRMMKLGGKNQIEKGFEKNKKKLKLYKKRREIEYLNDLKDILMSISEENEAIVSIYTAHIMHPYVFPLINNRISEELGLIKNGQRLSFTAYLIFKKAIDTYIKTSRLPKNIKLAGKQKNIYKALDEILWLFIKEKELYNNDNCRGLVNFGRDWTPISVLTGHPFRKLLDTVIQ